MVDVSEKAGSTGSLFDVCRAVIPCAVGFICGDHTRTNPVLLWRFQVCREISELLFYER